MSELTTNTRTADKTIGSASESSGTIVVLPWLVQPAICAAGTKLGRSLRRQRCGVLGPDLDPLTERGVGRQPLELHEDPALHGAFHGPAHEVEGVRVGLGEGIRGVLRGETHDQLVAVYPHAHVAVQQKGDAAEHLLFGKPRALPEPLADAGCELLVVCYEGLSDECAALQDGVPVAFDVAFEEHPLDERARHARAADAVV